MSIQERKEKKGNEKYVRYKKGIFLAIKYEQSFTPRFHLWTTDETWRREEARIPQRLRWGLKSSRLQISVEPVVPLLTAVICSVSKIWLTNNLAAKLPRFVSPFIATCSSKITKKHLTWYSPDSHIFLTNTFASCIPSSVQTLYHETK